MGEPNHIEDKLRDKLSSREFVMKDSWQADMDAKLDAFNSGKKGGIWLWTLGAVTLAVLVSAVFYASWNDSTLAEFTPRENATELLNSETDETATLNKDQNKLESTSRAESAANGGLLTADENTSTNRNGTFSNSDLSGSPESILANKEEKERPLKNREQEAAGENSTQGNQSSRAQSLLNDSNSDSSSGKTGEGKNIGFVGSGASGQNKGGIAQTSADSNESKSNEQAKNFNQTDPTDNSLENNEEGSKDSVNQKVDGLNGTDPYSKWQTADGENSELNQPNNKISNEKETDQRKNNDMHLADLEIRGGSKSSPNQDHRGFKNATLRQENPTLNVMDSKFGLLPLADGLGIQNNSPFVPELAKSKKIWELSLLGGVGMSFLNQEAFLENQSGLEDRSEISTLFSPQLDIRVSRRAVNNRLGLQTGLSLTSYGEDIEYESYSETISTTTLEYTETVELTIDSIFVDSMLVSIDSTFVTLLDSMEVISIDSIDVNVPDEANGAKRFTYIEVPIGLNYLLPLSERTSLMLQPELSFGYLLRQTGSYFTDSIASPSSTKSLIVSGSLGVGISHRLSQKLFLQGVARIRRPLGELNADDLFIQKYTQLSFQLGLGYRF